MARDVIKMIEEYMGMDYAEIEHAYQMLNPGNDWLAELGDDEKSYFPCHDLQETILMTRMNGMNNRFVKAVAAGRRIGLGGFIPGGSYLTNPDTQEPVQFISDAPLRDVVRDNLPSSDNQTIWFGTKSVSLGIGFLLEPPESPAWQDVDPMEYDAFTRCLINVHQLGLDRVGEIIGTVTPESTEEDRERVLAKFLERTSFEPDDPAWRFLNNISVCLIYELKSVDDPVWGALAEHVMGDELADLDDVERTDDGRSFVTVEIGGEPIKIECDSAESAYRLADLAHYVAEYDNAWRTKHAALLLRNKGGDFDDVAPIVVDFLRDTIKENNDLWAVAKSVAIGVRFTLKEQASLAEVDLSNIELSDMAIEWLTVLKEHAGVTAFNSRGEDASAKAAAWLRGGRWNLMTIYPDANVDNDELRNYALAVLLDISEHEEDLRQALDYVDVMVFTDIRPEYAEAWKQIEDDRGARRCYFMWGPMDRCLLIFNEYADEFKRQVGEYVEATGDDERIYCWASLDAVAEHVHDVDVVKQWVKEGTLTGHLMPYIEEIKRSLEEDDDE